jgi:hypothetical protein
MKDRDDMKNKMIQMSRLIKDSKYETEEKVTKLQAFFEMNKQQLNSLGPEIYMAVKNELNDIIKGLLT